MKRESAARAYQEIRDILLDLDSTPQAQVYALASIPDVMRMPVPRAGKLVEEESTSTQPMQVSKDMQKVKTYVAYPNAAPLRSLLLRLYEAGSGGTCPERSRNFGRDVPTNCPHKHKRSFCAEANGTSIHRIAQNVTQIRAERSPFSLRPNLWEEPMGFRASAKSSSGCHRGNLWPPISGCDSRARRTKKAHQTQFDAHRACKFPWFANTLGNRRPSSSTKSVFARTLICEEPIWSGLRCLELT